MFIDSHQSQTTRFFLEWFTETAMFRHFINSKYPPNNCTKQNDLESLNDSNYYDLFDARLLERSENKSKSTENMDVIMKNCRIINKKAKTFKDRFKVFISSGKKSDDDSGK